MSIRTPTSQQILGLALGVLALFIAIVTAYFFTRAWPLRDTTWRLASINGAAPEAGQDLILKFRETQFSGTTFCHNSFVGDYVISTDRRLFTSNIMLTQVACVDDGQTDQEDVYLRTLFNAPNFQVHENYLEVWSAAGETVLIFVRP